MTAPFDTSQCISLPLLFSNVPESNYVRELHNIAPIDESVMRRRNIVGVLFDPDNEVLMLEYASGLFSVKYGLQEHYGTIAECAAWFKAWQNADNGQ